MTTYIADAHPTTAAFGRRVKNELLLQGMSLRELARRMGEEPSSVSLKLAGKRPASLDWSRRAASELNVPLSALLP